ncbi:MAG TPA: diacylglycerol kinase family protein [Kofleriaceae bacterium]|nr:diacylglycerol kinase family protein [Kofleriaceae bacterium]
MKVGVIVNAGAGSFAGKAEERAAQIRAAFADVGVEAEVQLTPPAELADTARRMARSGVDAVVAAGGDGTVSAVASALVGGDTPIAVLPFGTLNHFARDIGVPAELAAAARSIAACRLARVDVGEVNGHTFINNTSIGLYPEIVLTRDAVQRRTGRRKWWAMLHAALRVLRRFPLLRVRVSTPERQLVARTPILFIGNNEYCLDALALGRRERLDAGRLSLYVMRCRGRLQLLWLMLRTILRRPEAVPECENDAVLEAWVSLGRKHHSLAMALDGEVVRVETPLHYQVRRGALPVLLGLERTA